MTELGYPKKKIPITSTSSESSPSLNIIKIADLQRKSLAYAVFEDVAFFAEPLLTNFLGLVGAAVFLVRAEARVDRVEGEASA